MRRIGDAADVAARVPLDWGAYFSCSRSFPVMIDCSLAVHGVREFSTG